MTPVVLTHEGAWDFQSYFDVADELAAPDDGVLPPLTLDDLEPRFVEAARRAADTHHLSWPPALAEAEEFRLDHHAPLHRLMVESAEVGSDP